jgi:hypothetical protein
LKSEMEAISVSLFFDRHFHFNFSWRLALEQ